MKLEVKKDELQVALLDYYKGSIAKAETKAEALYNIADKQLKEQSYNLPPKEFEEGDIQQLAYLMDSISKGLTKEKYVESYVSKVKKQIRQKLASGDLTNIKIPSKRKITIGKMLKSEEVKSDRIITAIIEGFKKTDKSLAGAMMTLSFVWPGAIGMVVAGFTAPVNSLLNSMFIGYLSGALLSSTLLNIPTIIQFVKNFSTAYNNIEKLSFFNNYYQALESLKWMDEFFKDLAEEFKTNVNDKQISPQSIRR